MRLVPHTRQGEHLAEGNPHGDLGAVRRKQSLGGSSLQQFSQRLFQQRRLREEFFRVHPVPTISNGEMTGVVGVIGINEYSIFLQNSGRFVPGDRPLMTSLLGPVIVQMTLDTGLGDPQICSLLFRPKDKKLARCGLR